MQVFGDHWIGDTVGFPLIVVDKQGGIVSSMACPWR
jgi:hypothetical protein